MLNTGTWHERRAGFLARAKATHGRRFSYGLADYVNNKTAIVIVCRNHGRPFAFTQTPHDHLKGRGCPNCGKRSGSSTTSRATSFTTKATKLHGGRYGYAGVEYVDAHTPVEIVCPLHGAFEQRPTKHLQGSGCSKCRTSSVTAGEKRRSRRRAPRR